MKKEEIVSRITEYFPEFIEKNITVKDSFENKLISLIEGIYNEDLIKLLKFYNSGYFFNKHKLSGKICFDIENENLAYSDMSPTHHGLQCNFVGGEVEYEVLMKLCEEVVSGIKGIDRINNAQKDETKE